MAYAPIDAEKPNVNRREGFNLLPFFTRSPGENFQSQFYNLAKTPFAVVYPRVFVSGLIPVDRAG